MICYLNDHTGLLGTIPWSFVMWQGNTDVQFTTDGKRYE